MLKINMASNQLEAISKIGFWFKIEAPTKRLVRRWRIGPKDIFEIASRYNSCHTREGGYPGAKTASYDFIKFRLIPVDVNPLFQ